MEKSTLAILVTVAFSIVGVVGDAFLKAASDEPNFLKSYRFYLGFAIYGSTAIGWVFVMRHLKLATISVVYSVTMIVALTALGVVWYKEPLRLLEIAGIIMAICSLVLLMRFA